jgi:hypothetical protein
MNAVVIGLPFEFLEDFLILRKESHSSKPIENVSKVRSVTIDKDIVRLE